MSNLTVIGMTPSQITPEAKAVESLELLAAKLTQMGWTARIAPASASRPPSLHVRNPSAGRLSEHIYAAQGTISGTWWYWWPWSQEIAPVTDVRQAAEKIARVLALASCQRPGRTRC